MDGLESIRHERSEVKRLHPNPKGGVVFKERSCAGWPKEAVELADFHKVILPELESGWTPGARTEFFPFYSVRAPHYFNFRAHMELCRELVSMLERFKLWTKLETHFWVTLSNQAQIRNLDQAYFAKANEVNRAPDFSQKFI